MEDTNILIEDFKNSLLQIDRVKASEIFKNYFNQNKDYKLMENLTIDTLEIIGEGWENGTISLAQVYMSGIICESLIDVYLPKSDEIKKDAPKMGIAVLLDHHALGKRIVYSNLRAAGYDVLDLGYGLSPDELVEKALEQELELLMISTLMLPSALKVKEVREKLDAKGSKMKIVVGGAPFRLDSQLWKTVGAHAFGKNASDIADILQRVVE